MDLKLEAREAFKRLEEAFYPAYTVHNVSLGGMVEAHEIYHVKSCLQGGDVMLAGLA